MLRTILKSKIHRARITDANLHYEGSLRIDPVLMEKANILSYEKIEVFNINNGSRFSTYAIEGKKNTGDICLNGAAARLGEIGDLIIIATYSFLSESEIQNHHPIVLHPDEKNHIK